MKTSDTTVYSNKQKLNFIGNKTDIISTNLEKHRFLLDSSLKGLYLKPSLTGPYRRVTVYDFHM